MSVTVSVIIPAYNHSDFIAAAIESVFGQTFGDYEIIVVNDGSPDGTAEVLRPLVEAGRVRYVEQANAGQAAARNHGVRLARGQFVAFLDDDDIWPADKLQWQVDRLNDAAALVAVGGEVEVLKEPRADTAVQDAALSVDIRLEELFCGNPFHSPGQVLIRASVLREIGGLDEAIWGADDLDLWMRLAARGPIVKDGRTALYYRMHPGNASKATKRMLLNCRRVIEKNLQLIASQNRAAIRRRGYRWLYQYAGRVLLEQAKGRVSKGQLLSAFSLASELRVFVPSMLRDVELLRRVSLDSCPDQLRSLLRSIVRGRPSAA